MEEVEELDLFEKMIEVIKQEGGFGLKVSDKFIIMDNKGRLKVVESENGGPVKAQFASRDLVEKLCEENEELINAEYKALPTYENKRTK